MDLVLEMYPAGIDIQQTGSADLLYTSTSCYLGLGTYLYAKTESTSGPREEFTPPQKTGLWTLGADVGRRYASISGDFNPLHLSGLAGKALGQKGAIAHGMYLAARMLEGREPEGAGHRWSISFEAPVTLPGKVAFCAAPGVNKTQHFVGWNPRTGRRHFTGELNLP